MAKKGEKLGFIPVRAFKKGQIPHNKGKIFYGNKICGYCHKEFIVRGKGAFSVKKYCSKKCSGFSNIGKPSPFKGIPRTEELKRKLSLANKGKKRSEKIKKEMSERSIGMHYSPNTEFKKGHIAPVKHSNLNIQVIVVKNVETNG